MIISVASGKGGTGKTTVAASLASVITNSVYIDCDVEEPNGHLMLKPNLINEKKVNKLLPEINKLRCNGCGRCAELCQFNALINLGSEITLVKEMCHSCGVCYSLCPPGAIFELPHSIGKIRSGITEEGIEFHDAVLNIGEASAVPLIKEVKKNLDKNKTTIIDSPPGTSCSMVEAVKDSDFCILVTEPTPFGLNDLKLAIDVLKTISIPFGVVINKYEDNFHEMNNFLAKNNINVLTKIPFMRSIAEYYSKGILPYRFDKSFEDLFKNTFQQIDHFINQGEQVAIFDRTP